MEKTIIYLSIILLSSLAVWAFAKRSNQINEAVNKDLPEVVMYKNPQCICCDRWASYLRKQGYPVSVNISSEMISIKETNNVPLNLASCHTAFIDDYVVEGHVPAEDINKMLKERPDAVGIAAPGMPAASPGMDIDTDESYEVRLFDKEGNSSLFATH
jgi:hypothetical protein